MFKKTLATAVLLCAVPALANASWLLSTQARNMGGTITSAANGTQTVANNVKSKTMQSLDSQLITAAPLAGYSLKSLTVTDSVLVNGRTTKVVTDVTASNPYTLTPTDNHTYLVAAVFSASNVALSANNPGGTVSPSKMNLPYGTVLAKDLKFSFIPAKGYAITDITGAPAGTVTASGAVNQAAFVVIPAGTKMTSALNLTAVVSNTNVGVNTILPQTKAAGKSVSITATATGVATPSYSWTYVSGPANVTTADRAALGFIPGPALTITNPTSATMSFVAPSVAGQYQFKVTESVSGTSQFANVNVLAATADSANQCQFCHTANGVAGSTPTNNIGLRFQKSIHSGSASSACVACHYGTGIGSHPGTTTKASVDASTMIVKVDGVVGKNGAPVANGSVFCATCHSTIPHGAPFASTINPSLNGLGCAKCHADGNKGDAHDIQIGCVGCHSVPKAAIAGLVNDNNGVRAIAGEFQKWSHHVVNPNGMEVQDEQCAVCHLEGTVVGGKFAVDDAVHMTDAKIHLRNAKDDTDMAWDPANPNHTTMDNFCMSCHSATGATATVAGQLRTLIAVKTGITGSATNPFCDTISNRYDKMMRPAVTDVDSQFNTTNNSHHGVKGPRYTGRTRTAGPRQIASAATFAANSSAVLQGIRSTMYDAGNFNALYTPLENAGGEAAPRTGAQTLGDDSTLHCGDCHTVGQWKAGSSKNLDGSPTPVAIGAHGSNNEYMLRNSIGTDERHVGVAYTGSGTITVKNPNAAFLVCYNCHSYNKYGSVFVGTGLDAANQGKAQMDIIMPHAGEYASAGRCNGPGNTLPFNGYTTGDATDGTQFESRFMLKVTAEDLAAGFQNPDFGNIYGIQCLNCHNSGVGNAYGGIHGSANNTSWNDGTNTIAPAASVTGGAYIDGAGNTQKVERFLPGLGNVMHVPGTLGGVDGTATFAVGGHISNDTNWEQKHWQQTTTTTFNYAANTASGTAASGAGCYTLGAGVGDGLKGPSVTGPNGPATTVLDTWGGCEDHNAVQGGGNHGFIKRIVRPITY